MKQISVPYSPNSHQLEVHELLKKHKFGVVVFHRGAGKKLALDTLVPKFTSHSCIQLVPLSEISYGDYLVGSDGCPTRVLQVHPISDEEVWEVRTRGGVIEACGEHLWKAAKVRKRNKRLDRIVWQVVTTRELAEMCKERDCITILPKVIPMERIPQAEFPYILGLWLAGRTIYKRDIEVSDKFFSIRCCNKDILNEVEYFFRRHGIAYTIKNRIISANTELPNGISLDVEKIRTSLSIKDKIDFIQGMMDQRGCVFSSRSCRNSTIESSRECYIGNEHFSAELMVEILGSLGCDPYLYIRKHKPAKDKAVRKDLYYVFFKFSKYLNQEYSPFRYSIYKERVRPAHQSFIKSDHMPVMSVTKTDRVKPMRCITVDAKDGLFCVGRNYVLTHNTWLALNELIKRAWTCPLPQGGRFLYIAPEKLQAKKIVWDVLKYFTKDIPIVSNESELTIKFPNKSIIELEGADNPERIRGRHPNFVVLDEVAQMARDTWYEATFPALQRNDGSALFIGTPKGDNLFRELFDQAEKTKGWFRSVKTVFETDVYSEDRIQSIRDNLPPAKFEQEYMCSFSANISGAYYADILDMEGIVTDIAWDPTRPVITGWDLGTSDRTVIWFIQKSAKENNVSYIIDYYENSQKSIFHYINLIKSKPYVYDYHILPHDGVQISWETMNTRVGLMRAHGMTICIAKKIGVEEGISVAQAFLLKSRIDRERCKEGINHLRQYRSKINKLTGENTKDPLHDSHSDAADALRTLAVGLKREVLTDPHPFAISDYDYFNIHE